MASRRRVLLLFTGLAFALLAMLVVALPGCGDTGSYYSCYDPIPGRLDHNGDPDPCCIVDPCHGEDDAGAKDSGADADPSADDAGADAQSALCPGACIPAPPLGWSEPVLLWLGAMGTPPPACPPEAPVVGFQGFADLVAPPASCGACSCDLATATCKLPSSIVASTAATCPAGGGVTTSFDPPDSWDGTCTTDNAIAEKQMCDGEVCVASLEAGPLAILDEACAAVATPPAIPTSPPSWQTAVMACKRGSEATCSDPAEACAPVEKAPAEFALCVRQGGDVECPESFPDRHVVATGIDDQRGCTPCACGAPSGGACSSALNVFDVDACAAVKPFFSFPISSDGPACVVFASAGPALLSKSTDEVKYKPGSCAPSGGEAAGEAALVGAATFCCQA